MGSDMAKSINAKIYKLKGCRFKMVSGFGVVVGWTRVKIKIFNIERNVIVFVIDSKVFNHDFLIGLDLILLYRLNQNHKLEIFQSNSLDETLTMSKSSTSGIINSLELQADLGHLRSKKRYFLQRLINRFNHAFAKNKFDVGMVNDHEAYVKLSEHKFIYRKPYKCSLVDQKEIESQISALLKAGLIEESTSPFAAPVTLAVKKQGDGSVKKNRLCIDYSALNQIVIPESQPFPLIGDLIAKARDCQWYSVLDINSAFWSVPLRKKDKYKTAFVTSTGHYNWKCLPFGLKTSPAIFQRILRNCLKRNGLDDFSVNYIDDILVFSKTFEEHLVHLEKLLDAVSKEGFRLSMAKCNFAKNRVKYLGHIIENNFTRPIYDNIKPVQDFPTPTNQTQVRQFLGKVNFYHSYIPNSASVLAPLHELLRKNVKFNWSDRCEKSFAFIKKCLTSEPCLAIYNPERETIVQTDASIEGIGAVLKQKQSDGKFHPVAFFSKKLTEAQKKKKAIFLECLAIKEALMYWRYQLLNLQFLIITDHKPLEKMQINTKFDEELRELLLQISQFQFKVKYQPGKVNLEADCLSRNPVLDSHDALSELKVVNFLEIEDVRNDKISALNQFSDKFKFMEENNLLFTTDKKSKKILVSDEFCWELVQKVHLNFGHIGIFQMELTILPYFYNPNLRKIINDFCKSCSTCIKNKSRISSKFGPLSHLGPAKRPFEYMSLDTIGGFSGNNSSHKYIHLLVDHFSRYAYAITSKSQMAPDFIKLLNLALKKDIKIDNLLADQYTGINSVAFKKYLREKNIRLLFTAVDCPFSNGLNERLNQTLVNRLRCKVNESSENQKRPWPKLFEKCLDEYNNTVHSVTRFTPNYLLNGVKCNVMGKFSNNVNSNLEKDRQKAFDNSEKNHKVNKSRYDKGRLESLFKAGDLVYVQHGNSLNRNKLDEIRTGPFKILNKLSNCIFEVDAGFQKYESNLFHVSKMYPFVENSK